MREPLYSWDIDAAHRQPHPTQERITFVERPPLFCGVCGAAVMQEVFGPLRREVWCGNLKCEQHGKKLNVFDRALRGESHGDA